MIKLILLLLIGSAIISGQQTHPDPDYDALLNKGWGDKQND